MISHRLTVVLSDDTEHDCDWITITESGALMSFDIDGDRLARDDTGKSPKKLVGAYNIDEWDRVIPKEND